MIMLSVIIPCYNESNIIEDTVLSARKELDGLWSADTEIIAVDNGSTDNTVNLLYKLDIVVIRESRRGRSQARNAGIRLATGEIIAFIDADCIPQPGWAAGILEGFDNEEVGCVAGEIQMSEPVSNVGDFFMRSKNYLTQKGHLNHHFMPYAATGNAAFRKSVIDQVGNFDENLSCGEDADLCWRMQLETPYRIAYAPHSVVLHHREATPYGFVKQRFYHAQGAVLLYKKYRHLMSRSGLRVSYWEYRALLKRILSYAFHDTGNRAITLTMAAWKAGLIYASIRNKVLYV